MMKIIFKKTGRNGGDPGSNPGRGVKSISVMHIRNKEILSVEVRVTLKIRRKVREKTQVVSRENPGRGVSRLKAARGSRGIRRRIFESEHVCEGQNKNNLPRKRASRSGRFFRK